LSVINVTKSFECVVGRLAIVATMASRNLAKMDALMAFIGKSHQVVTGDVKNAVLQRQSHRAKAQQPQQSL
jgi:hypothetical protein